MKNFIDRLGLYERFTSSLGNKYICTIATAGDKRAAKQTAQSMATLLSNGVFAQSYISATLGVSARFDIDDKSSLEKLYEDAQNLGKKLVTDIKKSAKYPAQNVVFRIISKLVLRPMYTHMIKKNKDTNTKGVYQNLVARNLI
jgi:multimeric flavodoxin WrbA